MTERFADPAEHAEEIELDVRMRVDEFLRDPRRRVRDRDAELLFQFARERSHGGFTGLELATRKFPIASVGLPNGTLRKQHATIGPRDHGGGDANDAHFRRRAPA